MFSLQICLFWILHTSYKVWPTVSGFAMYSEWMPCTRNSPINLEGEISQPTCLWLQWYSIQKQPSTQGNWPSPKLLRDLPSLCWSLHNRNKVWGWVNECARSKCSGTTTPARHGNNKTNTLQTLLKSTFFFFFLFNFNFWGKILFFFFQLP